MEQVAYKVTESLARSSCSPVHNSTDQNAGMGVPFNIQRPLVSRICTPYLGPTMASTGLVLLLYDESEITELRIIYDRVPKTRAFRTDYLEKSLHLRSYHA